jgi:NTP pyrophosphatase (non-canonical NTP hydrolase)
VQESWQGTTQLATIRIREGRSEREEEPDGEEEDEDDGALWETEEDTRELLARIAEEVGELEELSRIQKALIPRIE